MEYLSKSIGFFFGIAHVRKPCIPVHLSADVYAHDSMYGAACSCQFIKNALILIHSENNYTVRRYQEAIIFGCGAQVSGFP